MGEDTAGDVLRPAYRRIEELSSYFVNSVSSVQNPSDRFERVFRLYIRPALLFADKSFQGQPIMTILGLVFLTLSFIPVFVYLLVSCISVSAFILGGLISAFVASAGALLLYSAVLFSFLFGVGVASVFLTIMIISSFLLLRLGVLVSQGGVGGAVLWASDIKNYVLGANAQSSSLSEAINGKPSNSFSSTDSPFHTIPKVDESDSLKADTLVAEQTSHPE